MTTPATAPASRTADLWVGTYPADGPGGADSGEGVWRLALDRAAGRLTGGLAVRTPSPSFVALGGPVPAAEPAGPATGGALFAVDERAEGAVAAFVPGPDGGLVPAGRVGSGGRSPCHLLVHPDGRALYVANYMSGSVGVLTLGADGGFSAEVRAAAGPVQVVTGSGTGPVADRQEGPHAHSTTLAPGGTHLLVADLGTDELRCHRVHEDGRLSDGHVAARLPAGTGPRHLAVAPSGHLYVAGELSATVHVLAWDPATATAAPVQTLPATRAPAGAGEPLHPAHPVLDGDLLLGVRGADVVARFAVHDGGARLEHRTDHALPGERPRHMSLVRGADGAGPWLVVALQDSDRVVVLAADGGVADELEVPAPACVVPAGP